MNSTELSSRTNRHHFYTVCKSCFFPLPERMFVAFKEHNFKENETMIFFLQYEDNEENLKRLYELIKSADTCELYGDYSIFDMDIDHKISEASANDVNRIHLGSYSSTFNVCRGKFDFLWQEFQGLDGIQTAFKLDELFFACQIEKYFKKTIQ